MLILTMLLYYQNRWKDTAIFGACQNGHDDVVRVLIDNGANIDQQNSVRS